MNATPHSRRMQTLPAACAIVLCSLSLPGSVRAQTLESDFFVTDGTVNAVARDGSRIYLGGQFSYVGPPTGGGAPLSTTSALAQVFPHIDGPVYASEPDGSGGWFIGGDFHCVLGESRMNLAHILANGTLAPWNPGTNDIVRTIVLFGTTVFVGGDFTEAGGTTRNYVAALDANTGTVTGWDPDANNPVYKLGLNGGLIYAGGLFTVIGNQPRSRLAALLTVNPGNATSWNPSMSGPVFSFDFSTPLLGGTTLYVGGFFTHANTNVPRSCLAAFDLENNGVLTSWNPIADGAVWALDAVTVTLPTPSVSVYVGGEFTTIGVTARSHLAKISGSGTLTSWNPNADATVLAIAATSGVVFAGGQFTTIGLVDRLHLVSLDPSSGAIIPAWPAIATARVVSLELSGTQVFVGGDFSTVGGQLRRNLAALDAGTGQLQSWNPSPNSVVNALAVGGSTLYVGGLFTTIGSIPVPRNRIAALSTASAAATAWNPNANGPVNDMALDGGTLYVSGAFNMIGPVQMARNGLAALDIGTGVPTIWDPAPNDEVLALAVDASNVYAGGEFTSIGSPPVPRNRIAALSKTGAGAATGWNPDCDGVVSAILPDLLRVYVGGDFANIGTAPRDYLAAVFKSTGKATSFLANANAPVLALSRAPQAVIAGGLFSTIGGQLHTAVAALDHITGQPKPWDPGLTVRVFALHSSGTALDVGGTFTQLGGCSRRSFASFALPTVDVDEPEVATGLGAARVIPNPTTGPTSIELVLPRRSHARLRVLDARGREIARLHDGMMDEGRRVIPWSAYVAPGVYFVLLEAEGRSVSRKLVRVE